MIKATAFIATSDSGQPRAYVAVVDQAGTELARFDLGEYGYVTDAYDALRAAGWRVYPELLRGGWPGSQPAPGYFRLDTFTD